MQFIVMQAPKMKERAGLVIIVTVVEAATKAAALREAQPNISDADYYKKPVVAPLQLGYAYRL